MCGFSGMFDLHGHRHFSEAVLTQINDIQQHRGPDAAGLLLEPGVALGHRRLSVIDLSGGKQPLSTVDQSIWVVFNGEIYNFRELRIQLEASGCQFRTNSDTEVIVHAWRVWGPDCVAQFRGMFAFALWDKSQDLLFLARDRMGVKPLHYAVLADGTLVFGSELKVVTAHPDFKPVLDPLAVEEYFTLGYVTEARSIYTGVKKLQPGHTLLVRKGAANLTEHEFWNVSFQADPQTDADTRIAELHALLEESVRLRMIADVPLGAFLSGGVDSSAVVAAMARIASQPIETCAIGFKDPRFDESSYAAAVAARYGTNHHLDIVEGDDFDLLDRLAWHYDEPYADSSALPTYRVCQLARQHVTVALSGDGGDETFGGYRRYRMHLNEERLRSAMPLGLRRPLFGVLGAVYPKADWAPKFLRAKTTFQALAKDSAEAYLHSMSVLREDERMPIYSAAFRQRIGRFTVEDTFTACAKKSGSDDPLAMIQYIDYKTWLVSDINTKVDRASMAHSLEVREPLMDHKLIEWAARMPSEMKVHQGEGKWLFKKAMEPWLPNEILYRPKMGFSIPLASWLRGPLRERMTTSVLGQRMADTGIFDMAHLGKMVQQHLAGTRDFSTPLWSLLMFDAFLANAGKSQVESNA